jgi:predicted dehydrogenase
MKLAILGSGFISRFYADALTGNRRKDEITVVYSRNISNAKKFADDYKIPNYTDNLKEGVSHGEVDVVIIGLSMC